MLTNQTLSKLWNPYVYKWDGWNLFHCFAWQPKWCVTWSRNLWRQKTPTQSIMHSRRYLKGDSRRQQDWRNHLPHGSIYGWFCWISPSAHPKQLIQFTRAVLHGIHTIFPPLGPSNAQDDKLIAIKKLKQGDGLWDTKKEILGWLFDGIACTMQLPVEKIKKSRRA